MSPAEALLAASVAAVLVSLATGLSVTAVAQAERTNVTATATATATPEVATAVTTAAPTPAPAPTTTPSTTPADADADADAGNRSSAADAEDPDSLDYYSGYDYPDLANYSQDDLSSVEPGVIPEPSTLDDDEDEADNEVPGSRGRAPASAAGGGAGAAAAAGAGREWRPGAPDPDLHDHDVIDSVMYIYFGQQRQLQLEREQRTRTSWRVVVAGTVAAMVAQLLTLVAAARRLREAPSDCSAAILLNTEAALAAASLVFLAGVQATRPRQLCEAVSLALHYAHLSAACWLLAISVHVLHRLRSRCRQLLPLACPLAWLLPALVVLGCYLFTPHSYETRRYCWMSVERGMMFSYLLPVASLIFANTVVTVACVRELSRRELQEKPSPACLEECCCAEPADSSALCLLEVEAEAECEAGAGTERGQRALRRCAWLLPLFAVAWFLSVVALENPHALTLSFLHGLTTGLLNWYMYMSVSAVLTPCDEPAAGCAAPAPAAPGSAPLVAAVSRESLDCQPLLGAELPPPGAWPAGPSADPAASSQSQRPTIAQRRGELLEMSVDCISTISA